MFRLTHKKYVYKIGLSIILLPLALLYQLSFLFNNVTDNITTFHQSIVLALTACIFFLAWRRWTTAVYVFIFSIPLFNTMPSMMNVQPAVSVNYCFLGALIAVWAIRIIWGIPYADKKPDIYVIKTPLDPYILILAVALLFALPAGWFRFNNLVCPGFYTDAFQQIRAIPFFTQFDLYLCFTRVWQFAMAGLAFYLICSTIRHRNQMRTLVWLVAISGMLVSIYGLLQYSVGFGWVGINWYFLRVNATLNGPHAAGVFFATHIALIFTLMLATRSKWRKFIALCAVILSGAGLWFTGTRSAAFALLIVTAMVAGAVWVRFAIRSVQIRYISAIILVVILFIGPGYSLFFPERGIWSGIVKSKQFDRFTEGLSNLDFNQKRVNEWLAFRGYHWTAAGRVITQYPFTGSGIGTFDKLYRYVKEKDDTYKTAYAHSIYLDLLTEAGFIALLAFLGLYAVAIIMMWKVFRAKSVSWRWRLMGVGLFISLYVTFVANFFTSDLYYVPEMQLWTALLFALVVRDYQINFDPGPHSFRQNWKERFRDLYTVLKTRKYRLIIALVILLALLTMWVWSIVNAALYGYDFFTHARQYTKIDRILEYGIYSYEYDQNDNKYGLTAENVYKPIRVKDKYMRLYLRARHPDVEEKPVPVILSIDDTEIARVTLSNRTAQLFLFDISPWIGERSENKLNTVGFPATLHMKTGRTWNPHKMRVEGPNKDFGADLGTIEWGYFTTEK